MHRVTFLEAFAAACDRSVDQAMFSSPGTYSVVMPPNVYSISAVGVSGGQGGGSSPANVGGNTYTGGRGGGGGNLRYKNNIQVFPGETLTVFVAAGGTGSSTQFGNPGQSTTISRGATVIFNSDWAINPGVAGAADGGGDGGQAGAPAQVQPNGIFHNGGGGGGAGGYAGPGGTGATGGDGTFIPPVPATAGSGGGGGGGGAANAADPSGHSGISGAPGGGVGLLGQGANGAPGTIAGAPTGGGKGSPENGTVVSQLVGGGGPGGTAVYVNSAPGGSAIIPGGPGEHGGIRIIWPGTVRRFPSTRTTDE